MICKIWYYNWWYVKIKRTIGRKGRDSSINLSNQASHVEMIRYDGWGHILLKLVFNGDISQEEKCTSQFGNTVCFILILHLWGPTLCMFFGGPKLHHSPSVSVTSCLKMEEVPLITKDDHHFSKKSNSPKRRAWPQFQTNLHGSLSANAVYPGTRQ